MTRLPIHQSLSPHLSSLSSQSNASEEGIIEQRTPGVTGGLNESSVTAARHFSLTSPQIKHTIRLCKEDVLSCSNLAEDLEASPIEDSESVSQHLLQLGNRLDLLNSSNERMTSRRTTQVEELSDWPPRLAPDLTKQNGSSRTAHMDSLPHLMVQRDSVHLHRESINMYQGSERGDSVKIEEAVAPGFLRLMLPSETLAARTAQDEESGNAVKMIVSALMLRQRFIRKWTVFDSPAVKPPVSQPEDPWASTEPTYHPYDCPILPNLRGYASMVKGVLHVYSDLQEEQVCAETPTDERRDANTPKQTNETSSFQTDGDTETRINRYKQMNMTLISAKDPIPTVEEYILSLHEMMRVAQDPACKSLTYQRLRYLEQRFSLHLLFNGSQEIGDVRNNHHRDFYNVRKVDTHVHHSACMTQKHLLRFIRKKYRDEGDEIVAAYPDGTPVTLAEIFQNDLGLTAWEISIDHLNVHALNSCFHRFDVFNSKYNPFGAALLREVFMKTDNMIGGRYLAEITREVMGDLEKAKYQHCEWRISIYGHSRNEWKKLANWMKVNRLFSRNVRWIIQVPRLYHVYRKRGAIASMEELLTNIFEPVVQAVLRPQDHPEIFQLLRQTVGWDSVDDESVVSKFTTGNGSMPPPSEWTHLENPPYAYWMYYMYANIKAINHLLQVRGLNAMPFRPHCGEAGSISHLASAALLADGINHGLMLRKSPVLQYLYYLWQIGLAMSPLSNNALFHEITKSPFNTFFRIGLNVSLSADDPLMFHFTDEALLEEYSVCAHVWKLTPVDLCEIARNSILQSNFDPQFKRHWLGIHYYKRGPKGNDIRSSNVPDVRLYYREETLKEELKYLRDVLVGVQDTACDFSYKPFRFDPATIR